MGHFTAQLILGYVYDLEVSPDLTEWSIQQKAPKELPRSETYATEDTRRGRLIHFQICESGGNILGSRALLLEKLASSYLNKNVISSIQDANDFVWVVGRRSWSDREKGGDPLPQIDY